MRVALVRPLFRTPVYDPEIQEPLGIEYLAASLRDEGHEVLLLDAMLAPMPIDRLAREIVDFEPGLVGFSLMSDADARHASEIAACVRSAAPSIQRFAAGGSFPSTDPEGTARWLPPGTLIVRHEGELALKGIVDALSRGDLRTNRPFDGKGEGNRIRNLDDLPWPSRDLAAAALATNGFLNVQGSRGCTGRCSYCCTSTTEVPGDRAWRGRSPENLAKELSELNRGFGAVAFNFVDDDFLGPPSQAGMRARQFSDAVASQRLRIGFGAQFRPGSLSEASVDALVDAGLAYAFVGLESDDTDTLARWGRPPVDGAIWKTMGELKRRGVEVAAGAILFHPDASRESVRRFAGVLRTHGLLNYRTATSRLHLLPGSRLHEGFRRAGSIPEGVGGAYIPPMRAPGMDDLHAGLLACLAPLRSSWIHSASLLPALASQRRGGRAVSARLGTVRDVLDAIDSMAGDVLETLLEGFAEGRVPIEVCDNFRHSAGMLARTSAGRLESEGLVRSPGELRKALEREAAT